MQRKLVIGLLLIALITVLAGPAAAAPGNGKGQASLSMECDNGNTYSIVVANGQWASAYVADGGRAIIKKLSVDASDWSFDAAKPNWEKQSNAMCTGVIPVEWGGGTFTIWVDLKS